MIEITINKKTIKANAGERLIDVADREKINIPRFCYHKNLSVAANCRMCLVEIEGAPKLMPACTTTIADGMKVSTTSEKVSDAQKSVMEFLLINHPLDCPVCDQGGECELQDVSLEFGYSESKFTEEKRSFINPDIGPLISTELNRCIQCSRCVRFGQEIGGVMELGLVGRGMHTSINTFLNRSMDSELSGNVIDLCPVGALTAKPSRFVGRSWEMKQSELISMNDTVGSNAIAHIHNDEIIRVTPKENNQVNQTWMSDLDRFSYEGNNINRILKPKIKNKKDGSWQVVDWQNAIEYIVEGLNLKKSNLEIVVSPNQGAETFFMTNNLKQSLNLESKTHFNTAQLSSINNKNPSALSQLAEFNQYILIGTQLRYSEPMVNLMVRKGVSKGAKVYALETSKYDFAFSADDFNNPQIAQENCTPHQFLDCLKKAVNQSKVNGFKQNSDEHKVLIILGDDAKNAPNFDFLQSYISTLISKSDKAETLYLNEGSNSIASNLFACQNHINATEGSKKSYLLIDIEANEDLNNSAKAIKTLKSADFVISLSSFNNSNAEDYCDVILPLSTSFESGGVHVNLLNQIQSFKPAVSCAGESKPAWKVLTVLEQFLLSSNHQEAKPIKYYNLDELQKVVKDTLKEKLKTNNSQPKNSYSSDDYQVNDDIIYLANKGLSQKSGTVRRAKSIQKTNWAIKDKLIRLNSKTAKKLNLIEAKAEIFYHNEPFGFCDLIIDNQVCDNLVILPFAIAPVNYSFAKEKIVVLNNYFEKDKLEIKQGSA